MKYFSPFIAACAVLIGAADAADFKTACMRSNDERLIEIISPGEVGQLCDVRYTRNGGASVKVPYHADNSVGFCTQKAKDLVEELKTAGFSCTPLGAEVAAQTVPAITSVAEPALATNDIVVDVQREIEPEPQAESQPSTPAGAQIEAAPPQIETSAVSTDKIEQASVGANDLTTKMNEILAQPPQQHAAVRPPANLTETAMDTPTGGQRTSVVGRIVGAEPVEPVALPEAQELETAGSVTQASAQQEAVMPPSDPQQGQASAGAEEDHAKVAEAPAQKAPAETKADPVEKAGTEKSKQSKPIRSPEDIVRATLRAQAAAWNEGDLEAFMETYWKDDGLKFVSGGDVTHGWSATMKRYRERYADGNGLGQLGFQKLEVQLVTNDVAVVTGRFKHVKDGHSSSGVFSLVMRQDKGVWRIVHDHTNPDAKAAE